MVKSDGIVSEVDFALKERLDICNKFYHKPFELEWRMLFLLTTLKGYNILLLLGIFSFFINIHLTFSGKYEVVRMFYRLASDKKR
jgi:hypothetical protein